MPTFLPLTPPLVLGASLHDVLSRLKAEPARFPEIHVMFSRDRPVHEPVTVRLPANGLRLGFDGPEQRLRLVEVTDFSKNHITFKDRDVVRPAPAQPPSHPPLHPYAQIHPHAPAAFGPEAAAGPWAGAGAGARAGAGAAAAASGPTFRHVYHRLLGPTYGGEYIPPPTDGGSLLPLAEPAFGAPRVGVYVLSYPGVAFTFPLAEAAYSADKDVVSLLSPGSGPGSGSGSAAGPTASAMAVFSGDSWAAARDRLWTEVLPSIKHSPVLPRGKDVCPDDVSLVRIHGGGRLQLLRRWTNASFWIGLGETTTQDLVAELGPPNAIYRKSDQRMVIHRLRAAVATAPSATDSAGTGSGGGGRGDRGAGVGLGAGRVGGSGSSSGTRPDDLTDTDQSSLPTASDGSDDSSDGAADDSGEGTSHAGFGPGARPRVGGMAGASGSGAVGGASAGGGRTGANRAGGGAGAGGGGGEYFYNYFHLGFDVLVSVPTPPSRPPPLHNVSGPQPQPLPPAAVPTPGSERLAATKLVLHGNVPGSYEFNRNRRCRWEIAYLPGSAATSETAFAELEARLAHAWHQPRGLRQRGMVLNRGWGDSPGSSCEFLDGWDDSTAAADAAGNAAAGNVSAGNAAAGNVAAGNVAAGNVAAGNVAAGNVAAGNVAAGNVAAGNVAAGNVAAADPASTTPAATAVGEDATTTLFGFPGLVLEVLRNGYVNTLTVF